MKRTAIMVATIGFLAACGEHPAEPDPPSSSVVTTVEVTPTTGSVFISDTLPLAVTVRDQNGAAITGTAVTWSSSNPTVATVSAAGRVVGLAAGTVIVTAQVGAKSGHATLTVLDPGPRLTLDTSGGVTSLVGPAGDTLIATSSSGVKYTLIIPPLALDSAVKITMTPIRSIRDLPFSGGLQGGVEFQPSGLKLRPGVRLIVKPVGQVPQPGPTQRLVGFSFAGDADSLRAQPAFPVGGGFAISVEHFSGSGLALAEVADLASLPEYPSGSAAFDHLGQLFLLTLPRDLLTQGVAIFRAWAVQIKAQIDLAHTGTDAKIATDLLLSWQFSLDLFKGSYPADSAALGAALAGDRSTLIAATKGALTRGIASLNQQCLQIRGLLDPANALYLQAYPYFHVPELNGPGSGLTQADVLAGLCIRVQQSWAGFPNPFPTNSSAALDLTYGLQFGNDPVLDGKFFNVRIQVTGSANDGVNHLQTDAAGRLHGIQIATDTTPITITLSACLSDSQAGMASTIAMVFLGNVCHVSTITATPGQALAITTGALPSGTVGSSYSASLQASGGSGSYQWSVTAGQLPPGLTLAPGGTFSGTPTSAGSFNVTVQVVSGTLSAQRALSITVGGTSLPAITGAYDGTQTVTCCAPSFTTSTVSSGPARWWLLTGLSGLPPYVLVPGLLNDPTQPFPTSFVPVFNVPAGGGAFAVIPGASTALSGSVANGQLQFVWTASCSNMPPFSSSINGTCRVTFNGTLNPSAALAWHFDTDLEGWSCSSTNACKWQLLTSNQFPQSSGWVALQGVGEAVSRNIALPSNARFLRFDASTHNVPGDVSRVAVQVGGVTLLDTVFTNPGSNTAFNFVTMTVDISARAGQTVNIRFVQLDDGQGSGTTLKIDNISISPN